MIALLVISSSIVHVLADGDIERAVQINVGRDEIEIHYMVGMNEVTLAKRLDQPQSDGGVQDWGKYAKAMQKQLPDSLALELDGERLTLIAQRWRPLPLHLLQIECVLVAKLPEAPRDRPRHRLHVVDKTFAETPGFARLAIKPMGLSNFEADAPAIVARLQRKAISEMTPEEIKATRQTQAAWDR